MSEKGPLGKVKPEWESVTYERLFVYYREFMPGMCHDIEHKTLHLNERCIELDHCDPVKAEIDRFQFKSGHLKFCSRCCDWEEAT